MKTLTALSLSTLLVLNAFTSPQQPAPQESPELQEATTLSNEAVKLFNQGRYDDALVAAKRALLIRDKLLPRTDRRIVSALSNLGEIYVAQKDYKGAKEVYQRLLKIQEEQYGPESVYLAFTLDRLAVVYYVSKNDSEAEAAYKQALALREKNLGPDDMQVAQSLFAIAEFYRFRKKLEPALEHYRRAVRLYGKLGKTMTPDFERTMDGFACLGYDHNKPEIWQELVELRKEVTGRLTTIEAQGVTVLNGRALSLPKPEYPGMAAERQLSGTVIVKVEIDEAGNVVGARDMCQGPPYLSEAAVGAAWKARFTPTKLDGKPIKVTGVIQYRFTPRFR